MTNPEHSIIKRQNQARAQHLLKEYNDLLLEVIDEVKRELNVDITSNVVDEIALEYKRRQGGREALTNFMKRLNNKANERN